ncbi:MAG TPA: metallophosphoesterase [Candidatus Accumulibacter phosphatis]|nr:metallophosphoesterase [Candidatus Accumulibacter phosphatis]
MTESAGGRRGALVAAARRSLRVGLAWPVLLALLGGCAGFVPQPGPDPEPPTARHAPLTLPFIAVGDTQEHHASGFPVHDNDGAVDAYVEVAQRPPEQLLFGRRLLEWALRSNPDMPFLHLGDVMDLSCRSEAERMARIFRTAPAEGAILPGNHDGLMFGIYAYSLLQAMLDAGARKWNHACRRGAAADDDRHRTDNEAFSKRDFISLYLAEQSQRIPAQAGLAPPPAQGRQTLSWRNPDERAFVSAIEAQVLDGFDYADSFVAQRLRLPRAPAATRDTIIIGLDTNQAGRLVSTWDTIMGRSPGSMGHINPDQIRAVTQWVEEAVAHGDIVIFAGHHNWRSLGLPSRLLLRVLMQRLEHPLVYLSAHTHRGFWALHRALDRRPLLELNVSSLSDWPIAYRRISFAYDEEARSLLVRGELMPRGDVPIRSDADLLEAWEKEACAVAAVPLDRMRAEDAALVQLQRASRGSLLEWLVEFFAPVCEACEEPLYRHAQAYQDELLQTILQLDADLGREAHQLHALTLPTWCRRQDFTICVQALLNERAETFAGQVELFRRKAALVALFNDHLDDLDSQRARAYMSCRAVLAARADFEATPADRNNDRGEDKRRAEQFFRTEASVGME